RRWRRRLGNGRRRSWGRRRGRRRRGLRARLLPARDVLDRALLGLLLRRLRLCTTRPGYIATVAFGPGLFGLALRSLRRTEELRERAFTHAGAPTRHRAPPWRGRGTCSRRP